MTPAMGAGAFDGPLYGPLPPDLPVGGLSAVIHPVIHLIGWATCAVCVLVVGVVHAATMAWKHHRGDSTPAPTPGGGEATAAPVPPLGVLFLGYAVLAAFVGILFGLGF